MGTSGSIVMVAGSEMDHLRQSPAAVEELFFLPGRTPPVVEVREKGIIGWLLRLIGVQITQVKFHDLRTLVAAAADHDEVLVLHVG